MRKFTASVIISLFTAAVSVGSLCAADTPVKLSVGDGNAGAGSSYTVYFIKIKGL